VFRNTIADTWKARSWTPQYSLNNLSILKDVYVHNNSVFGPYWTPVGRPLANSPKVKRRNEHKLTEMKASEFLDKLYNPKQGEFIYHSANINTIGKLANEIR
jgi:hypothetical protein